jgi:hypothetical protein
MLAQEQSVVMRRAGSKKELEGGLGGELEGTLVLTNRQMIFVTTDEREDDLRLSLGQRIGLGKMRLFYSDVEDLNAIPHEPGNLFIPLPSIFSVTGHGSRGGLERPSLEVKWVQEGNEVSRVFIEVVTGRSRRRNLNDWAPIIEHLKAGNQKLISLPKVPGVETLEGKIMLILADMQRKGLFTIDDEIETAFKVKLDPDEVQTACEALASKGLVKREPDSSGNMFYRKLSPLGDDELSDY